MGGSLPALQQELQNCRNKLSAEETNHGRIEADIAELEAVRDYLRTARDNIRDHQRIVRTFVTNEHVHWRGYTHSRRFLDIAEGRLVDKDYKAILNGIQATLDSANTRRTVLRNQLLDSSNAIQWLRQRVNTLSAQVQNWFNWN